MLDFSSIRDSASTFRFVIFCLRKYLTMNLNVKLN